MSDNENNESEVTTTPEEPIVVTKKDPRKVEQGKRLAAISKEAKERKMRARIEAELREQQGAPFTDFLPLSYTFYGSVVVVASVFFLGTWWLTKKKKREEKVVVPPRVERKENKFAEL